MSLFKRFSDIISANINDLVDRMEDPEKGLKQAIREMEQSIRDATMETSRVLANQKRLEKELERNRSDAQMWDTRAVEFVDGGDDAGARDALMKSANANTVIDSIESQLVAATAASNLLKEQLLAAMRDKHDEAKRSLATLSARKKAADIRKQAIEVTSEAGNVVHENLAFEKFDRLREKVETAEAEAEALAELTAMPVSSAPAPSAAIEAKLAR